MVWAKGTSKVGRAMATKATTNVLWFGNMTSFLEQCSSGNLSAFLCRQIADHPVKQLVAMNNVALTAR
jgi:hypothetical protein